MLLFLASLGALFAASVIGCGWIRVQLEQEGAWPDALPALPPVLFLTLPVLVVISVLLHRAATATAPGVVRRMADRALAGGAVFVAIQAFAWRSWTGHMSASFEIAEGARLASTAFGLLSGLHAAHVLGGLVALLLLRRSAAGPRGSALARSVAAYWHFLGGVWLVLLVAMLALLTPAV
ncbi:MAG: hypothetical protein KF817_09290 [Phycisphaeraceae bacterium]|nr:hypothetical protein [Phycisphaeraceae bacterium]